jgi:hypothetical protein
VPAELGLHRLGQLAGLELERDLVERRHGGALLRGEVAAFLRRRRVFRMLLGQLGEVAAALELRVDLVGLAWSHEDVPTCARTLLELGCCP